MKILPINRNLSTVNFNGRKKSNREDERTSGENRSIDALRKQLMALSIASMALVGATGVTSCSVDEPNNDIFIEQCPKVDFPVKHMDGLVPKADYMMKLMGLLPENKSVSDIKSIETLDEDGNRVIMTVNEASDDKKIIMDYTLLKNNGEEFNSTYQMYDNGYGYITCVLDKAEGIKGSYKRYTQYSYNPDNLVEFTVDNGFHQSAVLKKDKNGRIKKILPDNSAKYYNVTVDLN